MHMLLFQDFVLYNMELQDQITRVIPPGPKTIRGQSSFLQASPTHLLYFNGCTVVLRSLGQNPTLYINHNCLVTAAKFSYGYNMVASIDEKGTLLVHYVDGNKVIPGYNYEGLYAGAKGMDWTSDNKRLCIVGSAKNKYGRVISVDTGTDVGQISAVTATLATASFRPQRPFKLAAGGDQFTLKFYEGPPYKFSSSKKSHTNFINQIKYSPDGKKIVSVSTDRKIMLYDGNTFEVQKQLENAHAGGIMGVAWVDNETFVTGSADKRLKKWNLSLEKCGEIQSFSTKEEEGLIDSFVVAVTYNPQNSNIYFVLLSGEIKQTDANLTKITRSFQGHRNKPIKILPIQGKQNSAVVLDSDGKILQINAKSNTVRRLLRSNLCVSKILIDFCISPSGIGHYITGDQLVSQFNVHEQEEKQKKQKPKAKIEGAKFITSVAGSTVNAFVCYTQNHIKIFQQNNLKYEKVQETKLSYDPTYVYSTFNKETESNLIAVGSGKGHIEFFSLEHSEGSFKISKTAEITNPNKITYIQKHGDILFLGDSMGIIRMCKWSKNEVEKIPSSLGSHTTMITSILVQGEYLHTFSMDNKYSVWKLQNLSRITTFIDVHRHGIIYAEIVGNSIVSCGGDLLMKVHEL